MNTVTTPIQPRSPEEIQRVIADLQRELQGKEQIEAQLRVVQAELEHAMAFEEQERKKVTDLHKLVRRWYLHIMLKEDWSGIEQIMNDTVSKSLAVRGYQVLRDEKRIKAKKYSPVEMPLSAPISEAAPVSFSEPISVPAPVSESISVPEIVSEPVVPTPVSVPTSIHRADYQSNGHITSFDNLDETIQADLSRFFQSGIDSLENKGISTWQQRIDSIITRWNRENPKLKLYKYQPGSNDNIPAGAKWKEVYNIHSQSDFCQRFSVVFPDWLQAKVIGKKGVSVQGKSQIETPQAKVTAGVKSMVGVQTIQTPQKNLNNESINEFTAESVVFLSTALGEALKKYKKDKMVGWNPDNFTFHLSNLIISSPKPRVLSISLATIPESQKGFWKAIISKDFVTLLEKEIRKKPGHVSEYNRTLKRIIIQTGSLKTITLTIPDESLLKPVQKKDEGESLNMETKDIESLKLRLSELIEAYLEWVYNTYHKESPVDKSLFTKVGDIVFRMYPKNEEREKKLISGRFGSSNTWPQLTYQTLQNLEKLNHYFDTVSSGTGIHIEVDKSQREQIKWVFEDPNLKGLRIEFKPY